MPTRMVRDGILSSEPVCSLSWAEEVFYRRLMSVADDHGRFYALPKLLRSACYPLQIDRVSDSDIGKWMTALVEAGLVRVYTVTGEAGDRKGSLLDKPAGVSGAAPKRYLEIVKFGQRVQSKSRFPDPPAESSSDPPCSTVDNGESPKSTALGVVEGVVEDEGVRTRKGRTAAPVKSPLPDDFAVSDRVARWAADKGHTRLDEHLDAFRRKAKARGYTYADWDSAFMEAIREDWANLAGKPKSTVIHGESPAASRPL